MRQTRCNCAFVARVGGIVTGVQHTYGRIVATKGHIVRDDALSIMANASHINDTRHFHGYVG